MSAVNAFVGKRALIDLLAAQTSSGQLLEGVDVLYGYNAAAAGDRCIYAGGLRWTTTDLTAEQWLVGAETNRVGLYIRVSRTETGVIADTDTDAEQIMTNVIAILRANRDLGSGFQVVGVPEGAADYDLSDYNTVSIVSLQVAITSTVAYG